MNFLITLILLFIILGIIVFVHELGHFLTAKKFGVYVDEFAIGMGPRIFSFKRKNKNDPTTYSIRAFPVGGFVAMASSEAEEYKVKKDQILENKKFNQKVIVLLAGIFMNCVITFVFLFLNGIIYGSPETRPFVGEVATESPAYIAGLEKGDLITKIDGKKMSTWDDVLLEITVKEAKKSYTFEVEKSNGTTKKLDISPLVSKSEEGDEVRTFGIGIVTIKTKGFFNALKYSITGFNGITKSMMDILGNLFTGKISVDNLSGPVGIYSVVDTVKTSGLESIIYLIAYLSLNVAVINIIPIPVFDGGRLLLVIIEKITKKKTSVKVENILNIIGFGLLIVLMLFVTWNDIMKLL